MRNEPQGEVKKTFHNPKLHGLIDSKRPLFLEKLNCGLTFLLYCKGDALQSSVSPPPCFRVDFRKSKDWRREIKLQFVNIFPKQRANILIIFTLFFFSFIVFGLSSLHGSGSGIVLFCFQYSLSQTILLLFHFFCLILAFPKISAKSYSSSLSLVMACLVRMPVEFYSRW